MTEQRGPTGEPIKADLEQRAYRYQKDRLTCCGCVAHTGAETGPCDCRCHEAARFVASRP